jgi:D-sedoheptulose 7-phosphate isomerase
MGGGPRGGRKAADVVAGPPHLVPGERAQDPPLAPADDTPHVSRTRALPDDAVRDRLRRPSMDRRVAAITETLEGGALAFAEAYLRRSADVLRAIPAEELAQVIAVLAAARAGRRQVFICGNGGSAATASHFAAGLGKEGSWEQPQKFRALALTDNVAWITSLANDTDYTRVFVEQLKNHAEPQDVLIAFSGSGNSRNVLRAVEWANAHGMVTVGISGRSGGELARLARCRVRVDTDHMGHVEEGHFLIQHLITYYFMETHPAGGER